jgi:hypothetical protein
VPSLINQVKGRLRHDLDERLRWTDRSTHRLIYRSVQLSLRQSSSRSLDLALDAASDSRDYFRTPWYDLQDVAYEALRRVTGTVFTLEQSRQAELWKTVAGSCGWWWPREDVCVVAERPVALHTEIWGDEGEVRLHCANGPAVRYADGWDVYAWHDDLVPGPGGVAEPQAHAVVGGPRPEQVGHGAGHRLTSRSVSPG